jgi:hypothetical protein
MNCKYIWHNLPNTIKENLVLNTETYDCIDNLTQFNSLASTAEWYNLPQRISSMCAILELPTVVTWFNLLKKVKEICEYIDGLDCE